MILPKCLRTNKHRIDEASPDPSRMLLDWPRRLTSSYFSRLILLFLALSFITVATLSAVLLDTLTKNSTENVSNISLEFLAESSLHTELVYRSSVSLIMELYSDTDILRYLTLEEQDALVTGQTIQNLSKRKSSFPFVHSIFLYNASIDKIVGTGGYSSNMAATETPRFRELLQRKPERGFSVWPRAIRAADYAQKDNVITVCYVPVSRNGKVDEAIILNIDEDSLHRTVPTGVPDRRSLRYIVDGFGRVVSHSDSAYFAVDFSSRPHIANMLSTGTHRGAFLHTLDGEDTLVAYVRDESLNWFHVVEIPYDDILSYSSQLRKRILVVAFVVLIMSAILSGVFSKELYAPIARLYSRVVPFSTRRRAGVNEFEKLGKAYTKISDEMYALHEENANHLSHLQHEIVRHYLTSDMPATEMSEYCRKSDLSLPEGPCLVVVMNAPRLRALLTSALLDWVSAAGRRIVVVVSNDELALVLSPLREDDRREILTEKLRRVKTRFETDTGLTLTIGLGPETKSFLQLRESYESARCLAQYRVFHGSENVFTSESVEAQISAEFRYPEQLEHDILNAIRLNRPKELDAALEDFIQAGRNLSYHQAQFVFMQLTLECYKLLSRFDDETSFAVSVRANDVSRQFSAMEGPEDVKRWFTDLLSKYNELRCAIPDDGVTRRSSTVTSIVRQIDSHFDDPNLSLDIIAERVGLSPGYCSKAFKSETGQNISDYLAGLRFDKAKGLLATTERTVDEIASECGMPNVNHFYYAFKRRVGLTPTNYRRLSRQRAGTANRS